MGEVEDIKDDRKGKTKIVDAKLREMFEKLKQVEEGEKKIYVNGESEEIRKQCMIEKEKVKIRNLDDTVNG